MEILHKQSGFMEHVLVAWKGPGISRTKMITSKYISAYMDEDELGNDVNLLAEYVPETVASFPTHVHGSFEDLRRQNISKFGTYDLRDDFHMTPVINGSDFDVLLENCTYKPSYLVDFDVNRYEGVGLIHETAVYPNDLTELTHMFETTDCENRNLDSHWNMLRSTFAPYFMSVYDDPSPTPTGSFQKPSGVTVPAAESVVPRFPGLIAKLKSRFKNVQSYLKNYNGIFGPKSAAKVDQLAAVKSYQKKKEQLLQMYGKNSAYRHSGRKRGAQAVAGKANSRKNRSPNDVSKDGALSRDISKGAGHSVDNDVVTRTKVERENVHRAGKLPVKTISALRSKRSIKSGQNNNNRHSKNKNNVEFEKFKNKLHSNVEQKKQLSDHRTAEYEAKLSGRKLLGNEDSEEKSANEDSEQKSANEDSELKSENKDSEEKTVYGEDTNAEWDIRKRPIFVPVTGLDNIDKPVTEFEVNKHPPWHADYEENANFEMKGSYKQFGIKSRKDLLHFIKIYGFSSYQILRELPRQHFWKFKQTLSQCKSDGNLILNSAVGSFSNYCQYSVPQP